MTQDTNQLVRVRFLRWPGLVVLFIGCLVMLINSIEYITIILFQRETMFESAYLIIYILLGFILVICGISFLMLSKDVRDYFEKNVKAKGGLTEYKHSVVMLNLSVAFIALLLLIFGGRLVGEFTIPLVISSSALLVVHYFIIIHCKKMIKIS